MNSTKVKGRQTGHFQKNTISGHISDRNNVANDFFQNVILNISLEVYNIGSFMRVSTVGKRKEVCQNVVIGSFMRISTVGERITTAKHRFRRIQLAWMTS